MSNPTALFVSFEQISYAFSSITPTFAQFFGSRQYPFDIDAPEMTFIGKNSIYYGCHNNAEFPTETFPFIQLRKMNMDHSLNKPYVNEVTFTDQNLS